MLKLINYLLIEINLFINSLVLVNQVIYEKKANLNEDFLHLFMNKTSLLGVV